MNTKRTIKKRLVLKKSVRNFITRLLITVIIFLVGMIIVKSNAKIKNSILKQVYDTNFKFTKIKDVYQKYFGNICPYFILSSKQSVSIYNLFFLNILQLAFPGLFKILP